MVQVYGGGQEGLYTAGKQSRHDYVSAVVLTRMKLLKDDETQTDTEMKMFQLKSVL